MSFDAVLEKVVSEPDPSSRNVVVEQLRCVGLKDWNPMVVSSERGIIELCPTLTSKKEILGFLRR